MTTFIVNGEEIHLDPEPTRLLQDVVLDALAQSQNSSRPPDDWELRHENGVCIRDQTQTFGSYGFAEGAFFYLTLRIGAGGQYPCCGCGRG